MFLQSPPPANMCTLEEGTPETNAVVGVGGRAAASALGVLPQNVSTTRSGKMQIGLQGSMHNTKSAITLRVVVEETCAVCLPHARWSMALRS